MRSNKLGTREQATREQLAMFNVECAKMKTPLSPSQNNDLQSKAVALLRSETVES